MLEGFSFLSVPLSNTKRVVDAINGTPVNGTTLRLEIARVARQHSQPRLLFRVRLVCPTLDM